MVKVIVVDDHPIFRLGLAASLAEMEQVELVGEAATAAEVLDLVERTSPDSRCWTCTCRIGPGSK